MILRDDFVFREFNYREGVDYYLDGYWQSQKYFISTESIIRDILSPSQETIQNLSKFPTEGSTSIHIRRGDYVTSNGYHPIQSMSYYQRALEEIGDYNNLLIFSDDINWCKDNLKFDRMIFIEGNTNVKDLWTMSLCTNNIIANSSFSWWGAWLNRNLNKKVIAPNNWFGSQANLNTSDIIPSDWIKI